MIANFYGRLREQARGEKVMCLECGASNPVGVEACENCGAVLPANAPMFRTLLEMIISPLKAMARVAAYAPVMQAFLVVVATLLIHIVDGVVALSNSFDHLIDLLNQYHAGNAQPLINELSSDPANPVDPTVELPKLHDQLANNPLVTPGAAYIGFYFVIFILSWLFLAIAMYYTARLLFKDTPRTNFFSLLSVAGFARLAYIPSLLLLIPNVSNWVAWVVTLVSLALQVAFLVMGAKFSTGLRWGRAAIVVAIPALIMQFLLGLPL